jgi:hypothetical protein
VTFQPTENTSINVIQVEQVQSSSLTFILSDDVAVVDVTPYRNWVYEGWSVNINVTVANLGNFTENATLDLYYNLTAGSKIGTETVSLSPNETETLTFTWNTTGIKPGLSCAITANATIPFDSNMNQQPV